VAATGAGIFVAVKAGADSDTGLMIAGIAIAAVGATAGTIGVLGGIKNTGLLKASRQRAMVDPAPVPPAADVSTSASAPRLDNDTGVRTIIVDAGDFAFEETVVVPVRTANDHMSSLYDELLGAQRASLASHETARFLADPRNQQIVAEGYSGRVGYARMMKWGMQYAEKNLPDGVQILLR